MASRQIVYPGSIPQDTDLLLTNRHAMAGLGYLALDLLGAGTVATGLACTPTAPATLAVQIAPGRLYSLQNIDSTAYGSLAADTTHQILKQGVWPDAATIACAAPSTFGFSINYLIQAAYQDSDTNATVLPYYNSANPAVPFSGPNNLGAAQATQRKGVIAINAKPGTPATTGTQTTPAADTGFVALYVVTVANGQSAITSGNIVQSGAAPFLNTGLRKSGGCLAYRSGSQTIAANSDTLLTWDVNSYDTSFIHNVAVNNSRFVVPGGVSKVSLSCSFSSGGSGSPNILLDLSLLKNSAATNNPGFLAAGSYIANQTAAVQLSTPPLAVVPGDYFEFSLLQVSTGSVSSTAVRSWAAMVIEG